MCQTEFGVWSLEFGVWYNTLPFTIDNSLLTTDDWRLRSAEKKGHPA